MCDHDVPVPLNRQQSRLAGKSPHHPRPAGASEVDWNDSLVFLCRRVIVANLERYPPEAFGIVDEYEWESLIRLRHQRTAPKAGSGGLDGTGRIAPALKDPHLSQVEAANPHLAESAIVDWLVWRDCTEFRFRRGGLTRPRALTLPWPLLVKSIRSCGSNLLQTLSAENRQPDPTILKERIDLLMESPMNVPLLQASGIGKMVKEAMRFKYVPDETAAQLKLILNLWKELAASYGVELQSQKSEAATLGGDWIQRAKQDQEDLEQVERCQSWRELFAYLKQREEDRRSSQGKRMREIRQSLSQDRPKVVKVRPTSARQHRILERQPEHKDSNNKMHKLRKEASVVSARRSRASISLKANPPAKKSTGSFGAAVAFAAVSKKSNEAKQRPITLVRMAGAKQMRTAGSASKAVVSRQSVLKHKIVRK